VATAGELIRRVREGAGLTQGELARRAGTSQAAVARYEAGDVSPVVTTLERLLAAGGCRLDLQVDTTVPALDMVMRHRERIVKMAAAKGAVNVRIFGSTARGEADASSDIDVLVDFDVAEGLWPMIELADELEGLLGRRVDVAPVQILKPEVAERALAEALPL
jgi:predicted nucleotidyltransferase/DNA-binding XRE family transcriptional regulator